MPENQSICKNLNLPLPLGDLGLSALKPQIERLIFTP